MFITIVLSIVMGSTGIALKFPVLQGTIVQPGLIRYIHGELGGPFTLCLITMSLSGGYMYAFPLLRKKSPAQPQP